jgi:mono/diheme cytochrome c family protein
MRIASVFRARRAVLAALALSFLAAACRRAEGPGERVFRRRCSICHGDDGRGDTEFAEGRPYADLTDGRWKHGPDYDSMRRLIAEGDPKSPMPAFGKKLTPEEIDAVTRYVETLAARATRASRR